MYQVMVQHFKSYKTGRATKQYGKQSVLNTNSRKKAKTVRDSLADAYMRETPGNWETDSTIAGGGKIIRLKELDTGEGYFIFVRKVEK
mgnify:CR=1 FL=1